MSISTKFYTRKLSTWQLDSGYVDLYVVPKKCNASPSTSGVQQGSSLRGSPMPTASGLLSVLRAESLSCRPPWSWTRMEIFVPLSSSSQGFLSSFQRIPSGVGGTMMTPSLMLVPLGSLLYHRSLFSLFLLLRPSSS